MNDSSSFVSESNSNLEMPVEHESLSKWLRKSVKQRSLFNMPWATASNEANDFPLLQSKIYGPNPIPMRARKVIYFLLYQKPVFDSRDIDIFSENIIRTMKFSSGYTNNLGVNNITLKRSRFHNRVVAKPGFDYTTNAYDYKKRSLSVPLIKFIDVIINTFVLFYQRVAERSPELLHPDNWAHIKYSFTESVRNLYYIVGQHYVGRRLCNIMKPFLSALNRVFMSVPGGKPILKQTAKDGDYYSCRAVFWGSCQDGNEGLFIHKTLDAVNTPDKSILETC